MGLLMSTLSLLAGCTATPATEKQRPAIDLAAPAKTETATFALG
jgi:hypothetical protein